MHSPQQGGWIYSAVQGQMTQDSARFPKLRGKMINDAKDQVMVNVYNGLLTKDQWLTKKCVNFR